MPADRSQSNGLRTPTSAQQAEHVAGGPNDGPATRPLRELRGVVERITYQNPENGYTVARLAPGA